jgi:hypothetical protein
MRTSSKARSFAPPRAHLRIYTGPNSDSPPALWRINGYQAKLHIWTAEEWQKLDAPPADAKYHPSGIWCALRLD